MYSHVKSPLPAKDESDPKADAKAKPRQSTPKVAAAVAIVAACWRVVSEVISKADVLKRYSGSTVHFGSLTVIVSIKGQEKHPNDWKIKARVVFGEMQ